jgi:hypothetical protein
MDKIMPTDFTVSEVNRRVSEIPQFSDICVMVMEACGKAAVMAHPAMALINTIYHDFIFSISNASPVTCKDIFI